MFKAFLPLLMVAVLLQGCVTANDVAKRVGGPPEQALELRNMQSRRFESKDEAALLAAATQTLQDLGYTISEASADIGVLVASKQRDAVEKGQIAGQIVLTIFMAALGAVHTPVWDRDQTINVTLVATPIANSSQTEVRVSFDRHLVNNHGQLWRAELILDKEIYREFFEKFSQSAFLEAREL